jgi:hypothetical protein
VADQAKDEILQLAEQGNLQALSVYLNRHLIPSGAHVKVKQKEDALHVLVVVMQEAENQKLIHAVQQILSNLRPAHINRVKVYTQVLGHKQASLRQQFTLVSKAEQQSKSTFVGYYPSFQKQPAPQQTLHRSSTPSSSQPITPKLESVQPLSSKPQKRRYSVAEFLARATNIEELKVLHNHPFFTGSCPKCQHEFPKTDSPSVYWDCPQCDWRDDLSQVMPRNNLANDRTQTSLTESKRLGDYLVEAGLLSESQIEVALADQLTTSLRFGEVLVRRGWIREETIEYLMQKIILPERAGTNHNAASYLESSRNLLKALLENQPPTLKSSRSPLAEVKPSSITPAPEAPETKPKPAMSAMAGKMANERETLILPDMDLDEYLSGA